MRRASQDGDEQDALTPVHHHLFWKPGERKQVKRRANRRERRQARHDAQNRENPDG